MSIFLSRNTYLQMIKFGFIGALGTIVNLLILYLFTDIFQIHYIVSEIFAYIISLIHNYLLNKRFTFKETLEYKFLIKFSYYFLICLISLIINLFILYILVEFFIMWYVFAELVAISGGFLVNFIGNKLVTFTKNNDF